MLWEAYDNTIKNIKISGKKIVEISDGWYIGSVVYPDKKSGDEMRSLTITIIRDRNQEN